MRPTVQLLAVDTVPENNINLFLSIFFYKKNFHFIHHQVRIYAIVM